ncbi:MAG TPA: alanine--tRNA ligase [Chlorobiota bacterium]|nr:alanine--tRNA ligase [Chlorobiota bacterium]
MTSRQIRQAFLDFFAERGHRIVPSAPVIPHGDPTLLFTNAGMNQFKDVFLGTGKRDYTRAADTQKCIRASGKHNDLEDVGYDTYHHTFFEMLGNWSFGDYFKTEAIQWSWELLTSVYGLDPERLHATVYRTDDESFEIWKNYLPESRIHRFDEKDNFWEMGETGPCGPCTEIHFDRTPDKTGGPLVNAGVPEVIEVWNNVFIQYNRKLDGSLEDLPARHVDTGMGFERITAVLQGKDSNYDTDVFQPIIRLTEELSGRSYRTELDNADGIAMRVIADHIRTLSFAIADGAIPGNEGRGYVLRRILRRAARYARNLGFREPVLWKHVTVLCDTMGDVFPEIIAQRSIIERIIRAEEESFLVTLERGLTKFDNLTQSAGTSAVSGADAFELYDTFGFPLDLTELLARERGLTVDIAEYERLLEEQRERSRAARKSHVQDVETESLDVTTTFTGYDELTTQASVVHVGDDTVVLDASPFYVEMGGQVGDTGWLELDGLRYDVVDVRKVGDAIVHIVPSSSGLTVGTELTARVDAPRRREIQKEHSATHILHEALRRVLGTHVQQSGSLVAPDRLRFDFTHFEKIRDDEMKAIEDLVNEKIFESIDVHIEEMDITKARSIPNAKMFFGDKYGDRVRVVTIDENFSVEFCGGTHVRNTSEIGLFRIIGESSIASGVRRIEALAGRGMVTYVQDLLQKIHDGDTERDVLRDKLKALEKQLSDAKTSDVKSRIPQIVASARVTNSLRIATSTVEGVDADGLKDLGDALRSALGTNGIGVLGTIIDGKVQLVCVVTDDLTSTYKAGAIVGILAKELGGGGGGKAHLATAGGRDVAKLPSVLERTPDIISTLTT